MCWFCLKHILFLLKEDILKTSRKNIGSILERQSDSLKQMDNIVFSNIIQSGVIFRINTFVL